MENTTKTVLKMDLSSVSASGLAILDHSMKAKGLPALSEISGIVTNLQEAETKALSEKESLEKELKKLSAELSAASFKAPEPVTFEAISGEIPEGGMEWAEAHTVFSCLKEEDHTFKVPYFKWKAAHPHVPPQDDSYIFRPELLLPLLYSLITGERCWLQGHTGSGKTTLVEQTCAMLNWPFVCINFDSEITRADLLGKMDLVDEGGTTVTKWTDGAVPEAMQGPYVTCFDELDFVRPDVAYVIQRVLENKGLRILEDGGREVMPHSMYRMIATGNTVGQGDEFGMYMGARPQSAAFLNRFPCWISVPYLEKEQISELISKKVSGLSKDNLGKLTSYIRMHLDAFLNADIIQPLSPRTYLGVANKVNFYTMCNEPDPFRKAIQDTIASACNSSDRLAVMGFVDKVSK